MIALAELQFWQLFLGENKDFALIDAAKLSVNFKVMLVERLKKRIEQTGETRARDLSVDS